VEGSIRDSNSGQEKEKKESPRRNAEEELGVSTGSRSP
jgi:hypothetical protein